MSRKYRETKVVIADQFFYWFSKENSSTEIQPDQVVEEAVLLLSEVKVFGRKNVFIQYKSLLYKITEDMAVAIDVLARTDRRWKATDSDVERLCKHLEFSPYDRTIILERMGLAKYISNDGSYDIVDTINILKAYDDQTAYRPQISAAN